MPETATLVAFAAVCVGMVLTPGPNMVALAALTLARGRGPGLAAVAGVTAGLAALGIMSAFGLQALLASYPLAWDLLRWGGAVFLVWLAIETWREPADSTEFNDRGSLALAFRDGLIINLLNPKAALVFVTLVPAFMAPGSGSSASILMISVYVLIATLVHTGIVLTAAASRRFLSSDTRSRLIRRVAAAGLVLIAIWLLIATAR
jgi:threonine/homoserine/homoserine lactone efflux protein